MIKTEFGDRIDELNRQVIHMDQGVAYAPEYRVSRAMSDYPSRKMEIARAVALGYLAPSERGCEIVNNHILSRQGERWQNFREDPNEYTDLMLRAREMFNELGFNGELINEVRRSCEPGKFWGTDKKTTAVWNQNIPVSDDSDTWLFLNGSTWDWLSQKAASLGALLSSFGLNVRAHSGPDITGWELFAHGLPEEGDRYLRQLVTSLAERGIRRIITTCGQGSWVWNHLMSRRGIEHDFELIDIVDLIGKAGVIAKRPLYLYAGSFYSRYLGKSGELNFIFPNEPVARISAAEEFSPRFEVRSGRVNEVNIWQKPLGPEHLTFSAVNEGTLQAVYEDAISDYYSSPKSSMVLCDPFAWNQVKLRSPDIVPLYMWELAAGAHGE